MTQLSTLLRLVLTGLALFLSTPCLFAGNTISLKALLDEHGKITNHLNLTGTVDFSGFYPVIDECEGLVFHPLTYVPGWNALGTGVSNEVFAVAISGFNVYVGGRFTDAGGNSSADYIARWDGSNWNPLGAGVNNFVYAIAIIGLDVYAGGEFVDAGGNTNADKIARWDGSSWNALSTGLNGNVRTIAFSGSDVYVGGDFTNAGGNPNADRIVRWDGTIWNALGTGTGGVDPEQIAISGSDVYVGGYFTNAGGNPNADNIARWDGTSWNALGTGLNDGALAVAISGSDVYAGGFFTNAGGNPNADNIARWDGTSWNAMTTGLNAGVSTIAFTGSDMYVGGSFANAGGNPNADRIARWNGTTWNALGTGLNNIPLTIAIAGGDVYVGGLFTDAGGNPNADRIARWDTTASLPVEWVSLQARLMEQVVQLDWVVASQINNAGWHIEHSIGGSSWERIGWVNGDGDILSLKNYRFLHQNPVKGQNYYRLLQMDFDGKFEYSRVISVDYKEDSGPVGEFYPNPSIFRMVNLDYFAENDNEISVSVYDISGKLVVQNIRQVSSGANQLSFDYSDLNKGVYFVQIGDERNLTHRKLIIER